MNDKQLLISGTALSVLALALASSALLSVNSLSESVNLMASASSALGRGGCALTTERPCYELTVGSNHVMLPAQAGEQQLSNALSTENALSFSTTLCDWSPERLILATLKDGRVLAKFTGVCGKPDLVPPGSGDNIIWGN